MAMVLLVIVLAGVLGNSVAVSDDFFIVPDDDDFTLLRTCYGHYGSGGDGATLVQPGLKWCCDSCNCRDLSDASIYGCGAVSDDFGGDSGSGPTTILRLDCYDDDCYTGPGPTTYLENYADKYVWLNGIRTCYGHYGSGGDGATLVQPGLEWCCDSCDCRDLSDASIDCYDDDSLPYPPTYISSQFGSILNALGSFSWSAWASPTSFTALLSEKFDVNESKSIGFRLDSVVNTLMETYYSVMNGWLGPSMNPFTLTTKGYLAVKTDFLLSSYTPALQSGLDSAQSQFSTAMSWFTEYWIPDSPYWTWMVNPSQITPRKAINLYGWALQHRMDHIYQERIYGYDQDCGGQRAFSTQHSYLSPTYCEEFKDVLDSYEFQTNVYERLEANWDFHEEQIKLFMQWWESGWTQVIGEVQAPYMTWVASPSSLTPSKIKTLNRWAAWKIMHLTISPWKEKSLHFGMASFFGRDTSTYEQSFEYFNSHYTVAPIWAFLNSGPSPFFSDLSTDAQVLASWWFNPTGTISLSTLLTHFQKAHSSTIPSGVSSYFMLLTTTPSLASLNSYLSEISLPTIPQTWWSWYMSLSAGSFSFPTTLPSTIASVPIPTAIPPLFTTIPDIVESQLQPFVDVASSLQVLATEDGVFTDIVGSIQTFVDEVAEHDVVGKVQDNIASSSPSSEVETTDASSAMPIILIITAVAVVSFIAIVILKLVKKTSAKIVYAEVEPMN